MKKKIDNDLVEILHKFDCLIIDNFKNTIQEELFYSILNQSKQLDNFLLINSIRSIRRNNYNLKDLKSRINSFVFIGIQPPTDDLLQCNNLKILF